MLEVGFDQAPAVCAPVGYLRDLRRDGHSVHELFCRRMRRELVGHLSLVPRGLFWDAESMHRADNDVGLLRHWVQMDGRNRLVLRHSRALFEPRGSRVVRFEQRVLVVGRSLSRHAPELRRALVE